MHWKMFVEGTSDKRFLSSLLSHLNVSGVDMVPLGGGISRLAEVAPLMREYRAAGQRTSVVLDANSDFEKRCAKYEDLKVRHHLPVDRFFLLPNHQDAGCLETLLERIAVPDHRVVYECFDAYECCLRRHGEDYCLPNLKARVYAYCEALSIETNPRRRDYGDSCYWDLNAAALEPLKAFLIDLGLSGA